MTPDPEALVKEMYDKLYSAGWIVTGDWTQLVDEAKEEFIEIALAAHPEWAGRNDSGCLSRPTNVSDKMALTDKAIGIVRERAGLPDGWIPLSAEEGALSKLAIELVEKSLKSKEK